MACGLAGTGVLLKLKILSCCRGKTSWGAAQGTVLAGVVTLTKSQESRQPGQNPDPQLGCVSLLLPPAWRQDTQCVTGECDNSLVSPSVPRTARARALSSAALLTWPHTATLSLGCSSSWTPLWRGEMKDGNPQQHLPRSNRKKQGKNQNSIKAGKMIPH